jgi:hypothetical protein
VAGDETLLCEIEWIDEVDPGAVTHLREAAADAIGRQNGQDGTRQRSSPERTVVVEGPVERWISS